jgi:hypothetical protein
MRSEATVVSVTNASSPAGSSGVGPWLAKQARAGDDGLAISSERFLRGQWWPAVVPGTVLTTLLANHRVPDPYIGLNNTKIPDASEGIERYTYWFRARLDVPSEALKDGRRALMEFRGINYTADVYLNGVRLTPEEGWKGMFLRRQVDVTPYLPAAGRVECSRCQGDTPGPSG